MQFFDRKGEPITFMQWSVLFDDIEYAHVGHLCEKSNDGTAGLQNDPGFAALRKQIERFAHVIYCSNPKTRDFWLGKASNDVKALEETYGGRKPCLHG